MTTTILADQPSRPASRTPRPRTNASRSEVLRRAPPSRTPAATDGDRGVDPVVADVLSVLASFGLDD